MDPLLLGKLLHKNNTNNSNDSSGLIIIGLVICCVVLVIVGGLGSYFGKFFCPKFGYKCSTTTQTSPTTTPTSPPTTPTSPTTTTPPPPNTQQDSSGTCVGSWSGDSAICYSDWQNGVIATCGSSGNYRQTFAPYDSTLPECSVTNAPRKRIGAVCTTPACKNKEPPISGVCPPLYDPYRHVTSNVFVPNNVSSDATKSGAKCVVSYDWTSEKVYNVPQSITCLTGYTASPMNSVCNAPGVTGECDACQTATTPGAPPSTVAPLSGTCPTSLIDAYSRLGINVSFFSVPSQGGMRCGNAKYYLTDPASIVCPPGYQPSSRKMKCISSSATQVPDSCGPGAVLNLGAATGACNWVSPNRGVTMPSGCVSENSCN